MILETTATRGYRVMVENNFSFPFNQSGASIIETHIDADQFREHWTIWHVGAIFGLLGGFVAGATGLILCAATYFAGSSVSEVSIITDADSISTCLTISMIPLLMTGAYCLDKIDDSVKKRESVFKEKKRARFAVAETYQKQ